MATELSSAEALQKLKDGNRDYVDGKTGAPIDDAARRAETATTQKPFAIVVSCSDSRVPPERIFNAGIGEIFVIRVAGNTVDTTALGSIHFAVAKLGTPLVVVLGHERCGAVEAAVSILRNKTPLPGAIGQMVEPIIPAALSVFDPDLDDKKNVNRAVRANAVHVAKALKTDSLLKSKIPDCLNVVAARYDLDTGEVKFFGKEEAKDDAKVA